MTWLRLLLTLGLVLLAVVVPASSARAGCASPTVTLSQREAAPGATVTIGGQHFGTECDEAGPAATHDATGPPATGLEIIVRNGGTERVLATVDAEDDGTFSTRVRLPRDLAQGQADFFARDASGRQVGESLDLWVRGEPVDGSRRLLVGSALAAGVMAALTGPALLLLLLRHRRRPRRR